MSMMINRYPASTGRLRSHQDRKQVKLTLVSMVVIAVCPLSFPGMMQSATFKLNISLFKRRQ